MKPRFGYCAVTCDFLHAGHVKYLKDCADKCRHLIVGIMTDDCVEDYKGCRPIMNQKQRCEMVKSIRFVHKTYFQDTFQFSHSVMRMKGIYGKDFIIFDTKEHHRSGHDVIIPVKKIFNSSDFKRIAKKNMDYLK